MKPEEKIVNIVTSQKNVAEQSPCKFQSGDSERACIFAPSLTSGLLVVRSLNSI